MKLKSTTIIIVLFVTLIISCKENAKKEDTTSKEEIAHNWSEKDKSLFTDNCLTFMKTEGVEMSKDYCDCLLESTLEGQPNPDEAFALEQKDMAQLFNNSDCLKDLKSERELSSWDEAIENEFSTSCLEAQKGTDKSSEEQEAYCDCALAKVKEVIPHPQHFIAFTEQEMKEITEGCE